MWCYDMKDPSTTMLRLVRMTAEVRSIQSETGLGDHELKSILLRWKAGHEPTDEREVGIWARFEQFRDIPDEDDNAQM